MPAPALTRVRAASFGLLLVFAAFFVLTSWSRIDAPFADSDEGINGAVWGAGSRSLREQGIVDSRFGGVRIDGSKYATHPPLIVVGTAVAEGVAGEHPWTTRAAAWLGAVATIPLLYALVRSLGLSEINATATTVGALGCHMFLVYGPMLDTMVVAFPFALATALAWHRRWRHERPFTWWATGLLALATGLAGWQGLFLVGLCALSLAARAARRGARAAADAAPFAVGALVALVLTLGWTVWTHGDLDVLAGKLGRRSGAHTTIGQMVDFQMPWLSQLLGLGLVMVLVCVVALRARRFRPLAALSLASVVLYALALREGSGGHQYWNYWGLLPAAVGLAYLLDLIEAHLGRAAMGPRPPGARPASSPGWMSGAAALALVAVLVLANLSQRDDARALIVAGQVPLRLVASSALAPGQAELPYVGEPYRPDDWLRYRGGPPGRPLLGPDDLLTLARDHPDFVVLVLGSCASPDPTAICRGLTSTGRRDGDGPPRIVRADTLAARLLQS